MLTENSLQPALSQQETDFLKRFSLRKFTVPKEKLKDHSTFLYRKKDEIVEIDLHPQKRVHIEYKELKRSLKTNVPWWLRAKGLEEDMNTERLAILVEESEDDYFSARLYAGVEKHPCFSKSPNPVLKTKLRDFFHRSKRVIEELLRKYGKAPGQTLNEITEVEERLSRVHRVFNQLECVRLGSGCEKCQGKSENDSVESEKYSEKPLTKTKICVCDLECVDKEIESLCCCLQSLLEEKYLSDDPCQYGTIVERLQEIRQSLSDFIKSVTSSFQNDHCPDPMSKKLENKENSNDFEKGQRPIDVKDKCIGTSDLYEEEASTSEDGHRGKGCSCFGKKNNSKASGAAPAKKESKKKEATPKTHSDEGCKNEKGSTSGAKQKENISETVGKCEGKAFSDQKTIEPLSTNESFYICCKETQTDCGNCNMQGGPIFIPCLVLKQEIVSQSSSPFDIPLEDNGHENKYTKDLLEPDRVGSSSNGVKVGNNQQKCQCETNSNLEGRCADVYLCALLNHTILKDDERCKDHPRAEVSKKGNKLENICPYCCKRIRPRVKNQSAVDHVQESRDSFLQTKDRDSKPSFSGVTPLGNNNTRDKRLFVLNNKEEHPNVGDEKFHSSSGSPRTNCDFKGNSVSSHKTKLNSESTEKPTSDYYRKYTFTSENITKQISHREVPENRIFTRNSFQSSDREIFAQPKTKPCSQERKSEPTNQELTQKPWEINKRSVISSRACGKLAPSDKEEKVREGYNGRSDNFFLSKVEACGASSKNQTQQIIGSIKKESDVSLQRLEGENEKTFESEKLKRLRSQESSTGKMRTSKIWPQPKLAEDPVEVMKPKYDRLLTVDNIKSELVEPATEEPGQVANEPKVQLENKTELEATSPGTESGVGKDCKPCIRGKSNEAAEDSQPLLNLESNDNKGANQSSGPLKADSKISQPEQVIRVCLCNKQRSSKSSKRNGPTANTESGTFSAKLPTKFCNDCFGKEVPIIKDNLADEIRKMIGNRKRNSVFLMFTVVKDDLYHMQISTENSHLGCLYATESATFAARDANGFDGCTTLSVTDTSNTPSQIESLVDHAFMVVQHEKRSSS